MRRILIAGCGYVGQVAGTLLAGMGHTVFGLKRNPAGLPEAIHPVAGDLENADSLSTLPEDLEDVIISVAAGGFSETQYRAVYLGGVQNLMARLNRQQQSLRRIVFTSSTGVYGQVDGEWVTEDSPTQPEGFSGVVMLAAETQVRHTGIAASVLRLGGIYGPGRTRLIRQVAAGEVVLPRVDYFTNRIHRDDAARAIVHVLEMVQPEPVYNVVDRCPAPYSDVVRWIAGELDVHSVFAGEEAGSGRIRGGNKRVSSERLANTGFDFRYPSYREGYRELIQNEWNRT